MSELKRYPMINITSRWDVEDYQDVYICSDIDPKLDEISKLKKLMLRVADDIETKVNDGRTYGHSYMDLELKDDIKELREAAE